MKTKLISLLLALILAFSLLSCTDKGNDDKGGNNGDIELPEISGDTELPLIPVKPVN